MDPYYPVNKLVEKQDELTECARLIMNRFDTPLTEKDFDRIQMALHQTNGHIKHLDLAMNNSITKSKLAK